MPKLLICTLYAVVLSTNTGKYYRMVRHMIGHADRVFQRDCCAEVACVMGHPSPVQNLLRLHVPPAASQTRRDRETSLSIGVETKPDKFLCADMITVLKKNKKREREYGCPVCTGSCSTHS